MHAFARPAALALVAIVSLAPACDDAPLGTAETPLAPEAPWAAQGAGTLVYQWAIHGHGANASFMTDDGWWGYVSVGEDRMKRDLYVHLSIFMDRCIPIGDWDWQCEYRSGWGLIPPKDVHFGGNQVTLRTDLAGNPDFYLENLDPGLVDLTWTANGFYGTSGHSVSKDEWGGVFRYHSNGSYSVESATMNGMLLGIPVDGDWGETGTYKSHSRSIERL